MWATGDDNDASVYSAVNEYLAIDRDGNCYDLDYPWRVISCRAIQLMPVVQYKLPALINLFIVNTLPCNNNTIFFIHAVYLAQFSQLTWPSLAISGNAVVILGPF